MKIDHEQKQGGWRDVWPNHLLISHPTQPWQPPQTNRAIQRNPPERENPGASPSPTTATFLPINRPAATTTQDTGRSASTRRRGKERRGIQERRKRRRRRSTTAPAGRNSGTTTDDDDTRARALAGGESAVNAARRPTDTRRRNETGVRVRTSGAGGGGWSEAAERARDGKEGVGDEKKLVGEVGEGYKEGGSHLRPPPLFLSLAPPPPFLSPLLRGCDDEARRLLSTAASPTRPHLLGWGGVGWWFLSLHLLPLITWRFPSIRSVTFLFLFYFL